MASLRDEIGDFVGIPHSFIEDDQQTAESRVVLMILRYHTNRKRKRSFPGYETIMRETGLSRQKTAAGIKVLVGTGWLVKHRLFGDKSEYEIRFPPPGDSSTMELSQAPTIVPQGNVDSSTMEQHSNDTNKIEYNKIKNTDPPVSPKRSYKDPVVLVTEPTDGQELIRFLEEKNGDLPFPGKEAKAVKWLLQRYSVEQCKSCFLCLAAEEWRTAAVTWKTVQGQIGNWVNKGEQPIYDVKPNGNGHRPQEIKYGDVIQDDGGDVYFTAGPDGTPMYNFRTAEAFAKHYGYDVEMVKSKWN